MLNYKIIVQSKGQGRGIELCGKSRFCRAMQSSATIQYRSLLIKQDAQLEGND